MAKVPAPDDSQTVRIKLQDLGLERDRTEELVKYVLNQCELQYIAGMEMQKKFMRLHLGLATAEDRNE